LSKKNIDLVANEFDKTGNRTLINADAKRPNPKNPYQKEEMLKQRLLTAIILIPAILWVLTLSTQILAIVTSIFIILGAWEWAGFCGWRSKITRSFYACVVALTLVVAYSLLHSPSVIYMLVAACLWWLLALYWLLKYQQKGQATIPTSPLFKGLLGFLILLPAWMALLVLHSDERYGWQWVIFVLVLIWAADSGAYFVGKRWGQKKLADKISPGKTWEGVAGALLLSSIVSLSYALFQSMSLKSLIFFLLLCLLTVIASIVGDLLESLFKRKMGLKDSGQILPGHGGILDRIDSLTSAVPIFVVGLLISNH